jgi:hypothetical protein
MPGIIGAVTGFIERQKGRGYVESSALQRMGKAAAAMAGGGNITVNVNAAATSGNGADTTEDTIFTQTLPANALDIVGRQILVEAYGNVAATSATKNARVYFGSTLLVNFAATTTQTGVWAVTAYVTKAGSNSQSILVLTDTTISGSLVRSASILSGTEADNAGIVIKVTGQSSAATANLVTCNGLIIGGYN